MADLFGRTITVGETIAVENARITFGPSGSSADNAGLVVSQVSITGSRGVSPIMDLKDGAILIMTQIPQLFQISLQGILTSPTAYKTFVGTYGDACAARDDLTITATLPKCGESTTEIGYVCSEPLLAGIGAQMAQGQYVFVASCDMVSTNVSFAS